MGRVIAVDFGCVQNIDNALGEHVHTILSCLTAKQADKLGKHDNPFSYARACLKASKAMTVQRAARSILALEHLHAKVHANL